MVRGGRAGAGVSVVAHLQPLTPRCFSSWIHDDAHARGGMPSNYQPHSHRRIMLGRENSEKGQKRMRYDYEVLNRDRTWLSRHR